MLILILAYLGGVLTILSPCILPVLPFVFARADRPFRRNGAPMLVGMALTFAAVATLAAVGGGWAIHANQAGRAVALVVLAVLGLTLLSRRLADWLTRPVVALGNRLSRRASDAGDSIWGSAGLGVATGLLWAPCAGPILGLLLTAAALNGASVQTTLLLLTYAAGAATSLAAVLLLGGRLFALARRSLGAGEWIRRGLGALVLCGVAAIALGLDTGVLTRVSLASTGAVEQHLLNALRSEAAQARPAVRPGETLPVEGDMPSLAGATQWLNSPPLTTRELRGKVVLVDFWTYSCINCLRALPYVRGWADKYRDHGLVVIGVHAPEFAFEKDPANVAKAVKDLGVTYPVALDNDYAIWRGFNNQYWPAHYFIDAEGRIRHHHYGEGGYEDSEDIIRQLLTAAGRKDLPTGYVSGRQRGVEAADSGDFTRSPETYVGYARARGFAGRIANNDAWDYRAPSALAGGQWALDGRWTVHEENAQLQRAGGRIVYRFRGRDLHLVLGPGQNGRPVRFRVTLDGKPPGADHGMDTDAAGNGTVTAQRLYQLVRQTNGSGERLFEITFLDPGVQAYAFTFG